MRYVLRIGLGILLGTGTLTLIKCACYKTASQERFFGVDTRGRPSKYSSAASVLLLSVLCVVIMAGLFLSTGFHVLFFVGSVLGHILRSAIIKCAEF